MQIIVVSIVDGEPLMTLQSAESAATCVKADIESAKACDESVSHRLYRFDDNFPTDKMVEGKIEQIDTSDFDDYDYAYTTYRVMDTAHPDFEWFSFSVRIDGRS